MGETAAQRRRRVKKERRDEFGRPRLERAAVIAKRARIKSRTLKVWWLQ